MSKEPASIGPVTFLIAFLLAPQLDHAHDISASEPKLSAITVDAHSSAGLKIWNIANVNFMNQEWIWLRFGDTGPASPLDSLSIFPDLNCATLPKNDPNFNPNCLHHHTGSIHVGPNVIHLCYSKYDANTDVCTNPDPGQRLAVQIYYIVDIVPGGLISKPVPRIIERVIFTNQTPDSLTFQFFHYTHLNVDGDSSNNTAKVPWGFFTFGRPPRIFQFFYRKAETFKQTKTHEVTVTLPKDYPNHWEIAPSPVILNKLTGLVGGFADLADGTTPLTGDITHAYQFTISLLGNTNLQANTSSSISSGASVQIDIEEREP